MLDNSIALDREPVAQVVHDEALASGDPIARRARLGHQQRLAPIGRSFFDTVQGHRLHGVRIVFQQPASRLGSEIGIGTDRGQAAAFQRGCKEAITAS